MSWDGFDSAVRKGSVYVPNCKVFSIQKLKGDFSGDVRHYNIETRVLIKYFPARKGA